jgi:putative hydrolase of the HAD superfamily
MSTAATSRTRTARAGPAPVAWQHVNVLLFDMFGVIARVQSEASKAELAALSGQEPERFWAAYWGLRPGFDDGSYDAAAYWKAVQAELGTPLDAVALQAADLRSWSRIDEEMVELLRSLRARGDRLGLLSNITPELADEFERTHAWLDIFDVLGFSSRISHAKPSRQAFQWCLDRFGVPAGDILFIDDSPANLVTAEAMGLRTHLFTGIDELRRTLG